MSTTQKNALAACGDQGGKAHCCAPLLTSNNSVQQVVALGATGFPIAEWEAAFPGQKVHQGMPNHMRRSMHIARAFVRAAECGDYILAACWLSALSSHDDVRSVLAQIGGAHGPN